jgi:hypothetical protein
MNVLAPVRMVCLAGALAVLAAPPAWAQKVTSAAAAAPKKPAAKRDGQRDFDFEFGRWKVHLRRLVEPLTGSSEWVDLHGISEVRKVWGGRANLGEILVEGGGTRIQGMSMRLYNPQTREWSIYWASSRDGTLGIPMIGGFANGRGEFYGQEKFGDRTIYARFIFSHFTPSSFRIVQSFSADGGKTWEPNWIANFTRVK